MFELPNTGVPQETFISSVSSLLSAHITVGRTASPILNVSRLRYQITTVLERSRARDGASSFQLRPHGVTVNCRRGVTTGFPRIFTVVGSNDWTCLLTWAGNCLLCQRLGIEALVIPGGLSPESQTSTSPKRNKIQRTASLCPMT